MTGSALQFPLRGWMNSIVPEVFETMLSAFPSNSTSNPKTYENPQR